MTVPLDTWRKLLATAPAAERLQVFRDAAHDIGGHIGNGLAKPDAVDELVDIALIYDFFGLDQGGIERIIGEEFASESGDSEADREADREMLRRFEEYDRKREKSEPQPPDIPDEPEANRRRHTAASLLDAAAWLAFQVKDAN